MVNHKIHPHLVCHIDPTEEAFSFKHTVTRHEGLQSLSWREVEWGGKPDGSRGLPIKDPNSASDHSTYHALVYIVVRGKIVFYNPQGVLRQYDQGTVLITGDMSYSYELVVENMSVGAIRLQILVEVERLFCPGLGQAGLMSPGRVLFWKRCTGAMDVFLWDKGESSPRPTTSPGCLPCGALREIEHGLRNSDVPVNDSSRGVRGEDGAKAKSQRPEIW